MGYSGECQLESDRVLTAETLSASLWVLYLSLLIPPAVPLLSLQIRRQGAGVYPCRSGDRDSVVYVSVSVGLWRDVPPRSTHSAGARMGGGRCVRS